MPLLHSFWFRGTVFPCMLMLCVSSTMSVPAWAAEPGYEHGRVSMQGSIITTPCAIATTDLHQSIEIDTATVGEMTLNGRGPQKTFSLNLVNCDLSSQDNIYFRTTFDGPSEHGLFSLTGTSGMGLQIIDAVGNIALPGQPLPESSVTASTQRLDYILRLVSNREPLKTGDYHAILRFKVDYF